MSEPEVLYTTGGGVATATLHRPERRNALTWTMLGRLRELVAEARADPEVRVLVLTGAGTAAFCAGADLANMAAGGSALELHEGRGQLAGLFEDLWSLGKPTIAKVRGACLAGGFGLALACDLVLAADDATFGLPEVDVGLWPFIASVPLCRSMPPKRALELIMTGRRVDAAEADRLGFVTRVVPAGDLDDAAAELASALAAKSPTAVRLGRDAFYRQWDASAAEALAALHPMLSVLVATDDAREGLAAFAEKRPPTWTGR
ncbi:MAG: enoyl-CoA hydratase-related protein [Acidimicrobiales bacterium]